MINVNKIFIMSNIENPTADVRLCIIYGADGHPNGAGGHPNDADGHPNDAGGHPNDAGGHPNDAGGHPNGADNGRRLKFKCETSVK
jgi:hypothetical protein